MLSYYSKCRSKKQVALGQTYFAIQTRKQEISEKEYSEYDKEVIIKIRRIIETKGMPKIERMDEAEEKRVELHMHTQMSQMDAVTPVTELLKRAIK